MRRKLKCKKNQTKISSRKADFNAMKATIIIMTLASLYSVTRKPTIPAHLGKVIKIRDSDQGKEAGKTDSKIKNNNMQGHIFTKLLTSLKGSNIRCFR